MDNDPRIEKRFQAVSRSGTFRNVVQAFALDSKEVLDIGCSYGEHLIHFGRGSVGMNIVAQESAYAKTRGMDVRTGNIEAPDFTIGKRFDAIYCNNLFEHLLSPHRFLIRVKEFLKPDGDLVLGVPCVPWLTPLVRVGKFGGSMASNHINFFTRATLWRTVTRAGWRVTTIRGFHFANPFIDRMLDPIYPHFYIGARIIPGFSYPPKRAHELEGYAAM